MLRTFTPLYGRIFAATGSKRTGSSSRERNSTGQVINETDLNGEIDYVLAHLRQWMTPVGVSTPLVVTPSRAEVRFEPLGVGLIIGTWNYPVMVTLSPLVGAISAGNTAVIKPSEVSGATAEVLARLIPQYMDCNAFSVVLGGVPETTALLEHEWDHIFYTGGSTVAKLIMTAAAKRLTPGSRRSGPGCWCGRRCRRSAG